MVSYHFQILPSDVHYRPEPRQIAGVLEFLRHSRAIGHRGRLRVTLTSAEAGGVADETLETDALIRKLQELSGRPHEGLVVSDLSTLEGVNRIFAADDPAADFKGAVVTIETSPQPMGTFDTVLVQGDYRIECPGCGEDQPVAEWTTIPGDDYTVRCPKCGHTGKIYEMTFKPEAYWSKFTLSFTWFTGVGVPRLRDPAWLTNIEQHLGSQMQTVFTGLA